MSIFSARFLSLACFMFLRAASAWGVLGHQTVAAIAEDMLTPKARAQVAVLLGTTGAVAPGASSPVPAASLSLPRIATWADDIRLLRPETRPWHYVTIQIGESRYNAATTDTPNVVGALGKSLAVLRDPAADRYAREEALKWTVHLVGDLHQPLHVGEDHDRGGNLAQVKVGRRSYNLHAVWDFVLLERLNLPLDSLRRKLEAAMAADPGFIERNAKGTVADWVDETHAKSAACYLAGPGRPLRKGIKMSLERGYVRGNTLVALGQLKLAAVRLAMVLNAALDPAPAGGKTALPRLPAGVSTRGTPATAPVGGADSAWFSRSEDIAPEVKPAAAYAWSANSKIYHYSNCADVAKIKPKNLRNASEPPARMHLHKGCPAL